jgi:hypothetical protein
MPNTSALMNNLSQASLCPCHLGIYTSRIQRSLPKQGQRLAMVIWRVVHALQTVILDENSELLMKLAAWKDLRNTY